MFVTRRTALRDKAVIASNLLKTIGEINLKAR
jgi:hypothetical protein